VESSIGDTIVARFLLEVATVERVGPALAAELKRLIDHDLLRREDALVELYERLAEETS
jgi:hypothetical protein